MSSEVAAKTDGTSTDPGISNVEKKKLKKKMKKMKKKEKKRRKKEKKRLKKRQKN